MDISTSMRQALEAMPPSERELLRAVVDPDACGNADLDFELAGMRLRNLAAKYREQYKRLRMRRHAAGEPVAASELEARLALLRVARRICESVLQEPGSGTGGD